MDTILEGRGFWIKMGSPDAYEEEDEAETQCRGNLWHVGLNVVRLNDIV